MAKSAEIKVKITADLSDFPEDVIDAIAERVAAKLRKPITIHVHAEQYRSWLR
jgi:hypothetical protein